MVFIHFLAIGRLLINVTSLSLGVCVWIVSWNRHSIFHNIVSSITLIYMLANSL